MPIPGHIRERSLELYSVAPGPLENQPTKEVIDRLIVDYVLYLIGLQGYRSLKLFPGKENRTNLNPVVENIFLYLIERGAEFEMAFLPRFQNRLAMLPKAPEFAKQDLMQTLNDIWSDGAINWERFLAHIIFTGAYCLKTLEVGMIYEIRFLVELSVSKLDERIGEWVNNKGGWPAFFAYSVNMNMNYYLKDN